MRGYLNGFSPEMLSDLAESLDQATEAMSTKDSEGSPGFTMQLKPVDC